MNDDSTTRTLVIEEDITIASVQSVVDSIKGLELSSGEILALDMQSTCNMSTPGVQLLFSLDKMLRADGGKLMLRSSDHLKENDMFKSAGFSSHIEEWSQSDD